MTYRQNTRNGLTDHHQKFVGGRSIEEEEEEKKVGCGVVWKGKTEEKKNVVFSRKYELGLVLDGTESSI